MLVIQPSPDGSNRPSLCFLRTSDNTMDYRDVPIILVHDGVEGWAGTRRINASAMNNRLIQQAIFHQERSANLLARVAYPDTAWGNVMTANVNTIIANVRKIQMTLRDPQAAPITMGSIQSVGATSSGQIAPSSSVSQLPPSSSVSQQSQGGRRRPVAATSSSSTGSRKNIACTWQDCKEMFSRTNEREDHIRCFHRKDPYVCAHCGDTFTRRNNWKRHEDRHAGERLYKCQHCAYQTDSKNRLQGHLAMKHQLGDLQECPKCNKKFSHGSFYQHAQICGIEKKARSMYRCLTCAKEFVKRQSAKMHVAAKHSSQGTKHRCPRCQKSFTSRGSLAGHLQRHEEAEARGEDYPRRRSSEEAERDSDEEGEECGFVVIPEEERAEVLEEEEREEEEGQDEEGQEGEGQDDEGQEGEGQDLRKRQDIPKRWANRDSDSDQEDDLYQ